MTPTTPAPSVGEGRDDQVLAPAAAGFDPARKPPRATWPRPVPDRPSRHGARALAAVLALAAGGVVGLVGAFLVPLRVGGVPVPVSPVLALVGNAALGVAAARATGDRLGSAAVGLGWLVVVAFASLPGPGGDVVLPASATTYAFLVLGALSAAAAVGLGPLVLPAADRGGRG